MSCLLNNGSIKDTGEYSQTLKLNILPYHISLKFQMALSKTALG